VPASACRSRRRSSPRCTSSRCRPRSLRAGPGRGIARRRGPEPELGEQLDHVDPLRLEFPALRRGHDASPVMSAPLFFDGDPPASAPCHPGLDGHQDPGFDQSVEVGLDLAGQVPQVTSSPSSMLSVKAYSVRLALDRNIARPSATHLTWRAAPPRASSPDRLARVGATFGTVDDTVGEFSSAADLPEAGQAGIPREGVAHGFRHFSRIRQQYQIPFKRHQYT
jgi:hypothetical protein